MLYKNETNKTDFLQLHCRDLSAPLGRFPRKTYNEDIEETVPFTYFTPKQFKTYVATVNRIPNYPKVKVVGNVCIYQGNYVDMQPYQSIGDFIRLKKKKGIFGCFRVHYTRPFIEDNFEHVDGPIYKKFDVYKAKRRLCMGYAEVGADEFVRLYKPKIWMYILGGVWAVLTVLGGLAVLLMPLLFNLIF